jgi:catechol 2,3-dioxygenase-like lactoylglutathione lyase family enzyme
MRTLAVKSLSGWTVMAGLTAFAQQTDVSVGEVIGPENVIFSVGDLERSVKFYRDALGLTVKSRPGGGPGLPLPESMSEALSNLTAIDGAKLRRLTFDLPGASFGLELAEFTGIARTPVEAGASDPGAPILALTVRDIDAVLSALKRAGGRIVTIGGEPVHLVGLNGRGRRFVLFRDPDGILIEISRPDDMSSGNASGTAPEIVESAFAIGVEDTETTLDYYRRVFGFGIGLGGSFTANPLVQNGLGAPGARFRVSRATVPGETPETWGMIEAADVERKPFHPRICDPGAAAFSLRVRGADVLAARVRAEGGSIVSRGGPIGDRPGGIFVRGPSGFLLELVQRRSQ